MTDIIPPADNLLNPAYSIITRCGGPAKVAALTGADISRVRRWQYSRKKGGTGGQIPMKFAAILVHMGRTCPTVVPVVPDDFFGV